jgi:Cu2+-exporting ATPase
MKEHTCFHCGLPVTDNKPAMLMIEGTQQSFCCHGCKTVCEFIINSGNADYYKHRNANARTFDESELPRLLDNLKLYDKEEIQREFVRSDRDSDWNEAWLILDEIRCAACMWLNERTLHSLAGVLEVQMDYTGQQARVRWDPEKIKLSEILRAITNIGYYAHPFDPSQRESLNTEQKQRSIHRIIFALVLGMLVMQSSIGAYFYGEPDAQGNYPLWMTISRWANVFICLLILAYPGQLFFRNAWRDLKNRSLGMDVPIVIGLTAAWTGSLYSTLRGTGEVYFESIVMFVIFLLVARHIELRSRITATALLDRTAKIIPQTVVLIEGSEHKEVAAIELKPGDRIQVSPGETLAVDGILRSSSSSFDESLLTGESLPVTYNEGDHIPGGAINVDQVIEVEVLTGKADSLLNEIHQLTQRSISFRPHYVDIAENVAGVFVATILSIATLTYLFWHWSEPELALSHMIAVLIVTCPCALALAAPVSLTLGAAGLNRLHILPVRMSAIEKLAHVDTIIFDKTGTLTSGKPVVDSIHVLGNFDKNVYLNIAARLEHGSHHPFAKAISDAALSTDPSGELKVAAFEMDQSKQFPGQGVEAMIRHQGDIKRWRLGNEKFVLSAAADLPESITRVITQVREQGQSILYLADDEGVQAIFTITDPLRNHVEQFIIQARVSGIDNFIILSGDNQKSVAAIAERLGIDEVYGDLLPDEKLQWLLGYQQQRGETNSKVLMFGDGINDAPTLAAADVSMTFSDATDLAKNQCDFIMLSKGYELIASGFELMRKTRKIILQNLSWAIGYNILVIPAAVMGYVSPWMAAIGMSLSSLLVIANSLRINKQAPDSAR